MAIIPLQKTSLIALKKHVPSILSALQKEAFFDISQTSETEDDAPLLSSFTGIEAKIADLDFVIRFLSPFAPEPQGLREKFLGERIESSQKFVEEARDTSFDALVEECSALEEQENSLQLRLSKIAETQSLLQAWKSLDIPLPELGDTQSSRVFLGSIETKDALDFFQHVADIEVTSTTVISENQKNTYFLLLTHVSREEEVKSALVRYRYTAFSSSEQGTAQEVSDRLLLEEKSIAKKQDEIRQTKQDRAQQLRRVKLTYDALLWDKEKKDVLLRGSQTDQTIILEGWIPAHRKEEFQQKVASCTYNAEVFFSEEKEDAPVLVKNTSFFSPFEAVTNLFGTPNDREVDPTPFLTPFFILFFGFCLTDAGYGILLLVSLLVARALLPLDRSMRQMTTLLLWGAVSTTIMGVLFGGYFGLTPEQIPFLYNSAQGHFYGQVFDPVNELMEKVIPFAYGLGILHLWIAVILGGVNKWRAGEKRSAVYGSGILAIFVPLAIVSLVFPLSSISSVLLPLLGISIIGFAPSSGNIVVRFLLGVLGIVNEAVSWLSNLLSYSRLFALGLATGVIALAFNSIAFEIGALLHPVLALPVVVVILLFGHSLNIGLNLLGAFIHSARLQFVEFFGGFFEGGGQVFRPFSRRTKYLFEENSS